MDFYVYLHRRESDNSVFYVGKGMGNRSHSKKNRNNHWRNIVLKNGYKVEIVQAGMQEWWAFELEKDLIALYGRENLCNLTDGGEGSSGFVMPSHSRKIMSLKQKKRFRDPLAIKNLSAAQKIGWAKPGVKEAKSKQSKEKMTHDLRKFLKEIAEERMKNPEVIENLRKKAIAQFSTKEARLAHGKRLKLVLSTPEAREKNRQAQIRRYENEDQRSLQRAKSPLKKKVSNGDGLIFDSVADASRWLVSLGKCNANSNERNISACCRGKSEKAFGYRWSYI